MYKKFNFERYQVVRTDNTRVREALDKALESIRAEGFSVERPGIRACYPISYEEVSPGMAVLTVRNHLFDDEDSFHISTELAEAAMAMRKPDVPIWVGTAEVDEFVMIHSLVPHNEQMEELLMFVQEKFAELTSQSR